MAVYLGKQKVGIVLNMYPSVETLNLDYVKQLDVLADVARGDTFTDDYSEEEMQRLKKVLINLTEDEDGTV